MEGHFVNFFNGKKLNDSIGYAGTDLIDKPQPNKPTQPKQFKKSRQNNQFNFQQNQGPAGQPHQLYNNHNAWQQHYNAWQQQNYNNYNPWLMPGVMQQNYNEAFPFLGAPLVNRRVGA